MRVLYPSDASLDLTALYAYPRDRWVRANMISSLDGAAQGSDGRSGTLGDEADREVFALLRAMAGVIVVGAGTARTEGYGPAELPATAPIAVVSRNLELDPSSALFTKADPRTIVVTVESSPEQRRRELAEQAEVIIAGHADVDAPRMLAELRGRGLSRVLCEGGPELLGHLLEADVVDELCLTTSPLTMGGGAPRIVQCVSDQQREWNLAHIIEENSALLTRWIRHRQ